MTPKSIKISSDKRYLQINYDENKTLVLPSFFLRACSPSAENKKNLASPKSSHYKKILIKNTLLDKCQIHMSPLKVFLNFLIKK